jgi:hexosaminidase
MNGPASLPPLLVPAPRSCRLGAGRASAAPLREELAPELPPEHYRLQLDAAGARAAASGPAGWQRAAATLAQLQRQYGAAPPALTIEDGPDLGERGYLLDVSRDRVPTQEQLRALVDLVAELKLNALEFYTEHTFAYSRHPAVWRDASPLTATELRELAARAEARGVALHGNQNCFGHLERWLRLPEYAELAETHGRFLFEGIELQGPFSLCPTDPRSLPFVRGLLGELLPNLRSRVVNIGGDETQDVGQGRSRETVQARGAFAVYAAHLAGVAEAAVEFGCEPRCWADIALHFPGRLCELHPALVPIAWGYEPHSPFAAQAAILARSGRPFHLCCGSSSWRSFTGRTGERRGNLEACLGAARAHGARGVLLAEWGDLGHRQVAAVGRLALAEFAARSWRADAAVDLRAIALQVFGDRSLSVAAWLAELGDLDRDLRQVSGPRGADGGARPLPNASALFEELHPSGFAFALPADPRPWAQVLERLNELRRTRPAVEPGLDAELEHALDQAEFALRLALVRRTGRTDRGLQERLERLRAEHRRQWLLTSRPGGLEDSLAHWRMLSPLPDP